jgi:hypothetical protein
MTSMTIFVTTVIAIQSFAAAAAAVEISDTIGGKRARGQLRDGDTNLFPFPG